MSYIPLIHGKDSTERVVSIEPSEYTAEVFTELEDGSVKSSWVPNRYWILAPRIPQDSFGWTKLGGSLHYQYGKQYRTRYEFLKAKGQLRRHDTYSIFDPREALMVKDGYTYHKGLKVEDVSTLAFDIETNGLVKGPDSKVLLIANTFRRKDRVSRRLFDLHDYTSQGQMIDDWCKWVREVNPTVLVGHNIVIFDLPYLSFCAALEGFSLELGRDGSIIHYDSYESRLRKDGSQSYSYNRCRVYGREVVDTFFLSLKYDIARKYNSYGLKQIIKQENLEVQGRQFYDATKIFQVYDNAEEWGKVCAYAEHDGDDALSLYDLMIPSLFYLCQSVPKSLQNIVETASGSQINSMVVRSYLQQGHSIPRADNVEGYEGAISFGNPGIYKNVIKVDVQSLYPSIMLTYDIFDKVKDPQGNLKQMLEYFIERRIEYKILAKKTGDNYYVQLDSGSKTFCNSIYGFYNAKGLNFNFKEGASTTTKYGREILQKAVVWATGKEYDVSAA